MLKKMGFKEIEGAENGLVMVNKVQEKILNNDMYDLILCDLMMPEYVTYNFSF